MKVYQLILDKILYPVLNTTKDQVQKETQTKITNEIREKTNWRVWRQVGSQIRKELSK